MKKIFKLFGLEEIQVLTGVHLYSDGLQTYEDSAIQFTHLGDFDDELGALLEAQRIIDKGIGTYDHGLEIKGVYIKAD